MNIDIFSQGQSGVKGTLISEDGENLLYANECLIGESGQILGMQKGMSYELVTADDHFSIDFESGHGVSNGVSLKILIDMLVHHGVAALDREHTEKLSLAIRALKMAQDALN